MGKPLFSGGFVDLGKGDDYIWSWTIHRHIYGF
jgi:hypothetical protein